VIGASILDLKDLLKKKEVTSKQIVCALASQVADVGVDLNLLADADLEKSLEEAEAADVFMKNNSYDKWLPLTGIPISIKDNLHVKGMLTSFGLCSKINNFAKEDSHVVNVLRKLGAVIFVKTNIPQAIMSMESSNNLWGNTLNPWNHTKTCGGSSGGEAGLVASGCSAGGIGSDIGGSIRAPASFCGIFGLRPSRRRFSLMGMAILSGNYNY